MTENYIKKYPITSPMAEDTKLILNKLGSIKEELDYIKRHIVDVDRVMIDDDIESLREAEEDLKRGKTKRLV